MDQTPYIPRDADSVLDQWLVSPYRKPLILKGARQVGKSRLVTEFARRQGLKLVTVNLERNPEVSRIFQSMDVEKVCFEISLFTGVTLSEPGTLLFLDEVQSQPQVIGLLRYFYEEKAKLPVIAAGSLLDFALREPTFSMPVGRVEYLYLSPLSFKEVSSARGRVLQRQFVEDFVGGHVSHFSPMVHTTLLEDLEDYLFVGGLPRATSAFLDGLKLGDKFTAMQWAAKEVAEAVVSYKDDFRKVPARRNSPVTLAALHRVVEALPQLVGEPKVKFSHIDKSLKSLNLRQSLEHLKMSRFLHIVTHTRVDGLPLSSGRCRDTFKLLPLDLGVLVTLRLGMDRTLQSSRVLLRDWAQGTPFASKWLGQLAECFVGLSLLGARSLKYSPSLDYWLREGKRGSAEVDYVISWGLETVPIEVKAGASGSLKSLHLLMAERNLAHAIRFDLNPPSVQQIDTVTPLGGGGRGRAKYTLHNLPLYIADWVYPYVAGVTEARQGACGGESRQG